MRGSWIWRKKIDLVTPDEDFGQTLGFYGVKPGPYLVLPFLQPFTVRDFAGYVTDIFLNPINWLVAPIIEVEGVPSLIAHKNRTTTTFVQIGVRVGEIVNERSTEPRKIPGRRRSDARSLHRRPECLSAISRESDSGIMPASSPLR